MGSSCSCFKSIKEPINLKAKHNTLAPYKLKSIYPTNLANSSIKNSNAHTKDNWNVEDDGNFSENTSNLIKSRGLNTSQKKKNEEVIKIKKNENVQQNDNLEIFNNFAEPLVKLIRICTLNKRDYERNSDLDDSFELDENRKFPVMIKYEEVAP